MCWDIAPDAACCLAHAVQDKVQRGYRGTHNHEKELACGPGQGVVRCPCLVGSVAELHERLGFYAREDACEDVEDEDDCELELFSHGVVELPEDGGGDDGKACVGKGVECFFLGGGRHVSLVLFMLMSRTGVVENVDFRG